MQQDGSFLDQPEGVVDRSDGLFIVCIEQAQRIIGVAQDVGDQEFGEQANDGDVSGTDHRLAVGVQYASNAIGANFYAGLLDEVVYLSGRVFTSGEVASLYNSGTRTNPHRISSIQSDIRVWWRMGDSRDSATTVFDEIGSNNLTLVNMDGSNYVTP